MGGVISNSYVPARTFSRCLAVLFSTTQRCTPCNSNSWPNTWSVNNDLFIPARGHRYGSRRTPDRVQKRFSTSAVARFTTSLTCNIRRTILLSSNVAPAVSPAAAQGYPDRQTKQRRQQRWKTQLAHPSVVNLRMLQRPVDTQPGQRRAKIRKSGHYYDYDDNFSIIADDYWLLFDRLFRRVLFPWKFDASNNCGVSYSMWAKCRYL